MGDLGCQGEEPILRVGLQSCNWNQAWAALLIALTLTAAPTPLIWNYRTGNYSWAVAVSQDGRYVIAGSDDLHVYFFDTSLAEGKPLWSYATHGYVRHVAIAKDGSRAAAGDTGGGVFIFRPFVPSSLVWSFRTSSPIEALVMTGDGHYLAVGDRKGTIYFIKTTLADLPPCQYAIPSGVLELSISDSGMLAATAAGGGLYFFGKTSSQLSYNWSFEVGTSFPKLAMVREASHIVVGANNGSVYLVDGSGQLMDRRRVRGAVSALSISDTDDRVLIASTGGNVTLYLMHDRLEELESSEAQKPITSAVISGNGKRISFAQLDGAISMFNQSLATQMWAFNAGGIVHSLSISYSGQVMAAASDTGDIYVFDERGSQRITRTILSGVLVATVIALAAGSVIWGRRRKLNESSREESFLAHVASIDSGT